MTDNKQETYQRNLNMLVQNTEYLLSAYKVGELPLPERRFNMYDCTLYKDAKISFCTEHGCYDCGPHNCTHGRGIDGWEDYCRNVFGMDNQSVYDYIFGPIGINSRNVNDYLFNQEREISLVPTGTKQMTDCIKFVKHDKPIMTIHADGRITLHDDAQPTEAAASCIEAMSDMIQDMIKEAVLQEQSK